MKANSLAYTLTTGMLRAALVLALLVSGWFVYNRLPHQEPSTKATSAQTSLQIVLRVADNDSAEPLDIPFELYPFDIVAARHEFFTERRAGKRFDDFLNERMKGRKPIDGKLDKQGQVIVSVNGGIWWLHAQLPGEENLEWRLPVEVIGPKQTVELTPQNIYMRTKSF